MRRCPLGILTETALSFPVSAPLLPRPLRLISGLSDNHYIKIPISVPEWQLLSVSSKMSGASGVEQKEG
jgi:hypothetical protein